MKIRFLVLAGLLVHSLPVFAQEGEESIDPYDPYDPYSYQEEATSQEAPAPIKAVPTEPKEPAVDIPPAPTDSTPHSKLLAPLSFGIMANNQMFNSVKEIQDFSRVNTSMKTTHSSGDEHLFNLYHETSAKVLDSYVMYNLVLQFTPSAKDNDGLLAFELRVANPDSVAAIPANGELIGKTKCNPLYPPCSLYIQGVRGSPMSKHPLMYFDYKGGSEVPYINLSNFTRTGTYILVGYYKDLSIKYSLLKLGGTAW